MIDCQWNIFACFDYLRVIYVTPQMLELLKSKGFNGQLSSNPDALAGDPFTFLQLFPDPTIPAYLPSIYPPYSTFGLPVYH
jgi:hypothetical protein